MAVTEENVVLEERRPAAAQIALIAVGLLVLLGLVWFFLLRGDGEETGTATPAPAPVTEDTEPEEVTPVDKQAPVETFEVFAPKDPFDPLVSTSSGDSGLGGGSAATVLGGADPGTTTTTTSEGTTTTTTTTSGATPGGGAEEVGGHRVRVIDVFGQGGGRRAQIQVDGTVYTVDEGERFAENFQLMSTSGRCATMLFGDDEFTLCEGEEILK